MTDEERIELDQSLERKTVRAALATRALLVVGVVLALTVIGLQLTTTFAIRDTQKENVSRSKETQANTETIKRLADRIDSCTTPSGECYRRSQAQTGEAVASINDVIIAAAVCAKVPGNDTVREVRACVREALGAG